MDEGPWDTPIPPKDVLVTNNNWDEEDEKLSNLTSKLARPGTSNTPKSTNNKGWGTNSQNGWDNPINTNNTNNVNNTSQFNRRKSSSGNIDVWGGNTTQSESKRENPVAQSEWDTHNEMDRSQPSNLRASPSK